jgi:hypothetical protein
MCFFGHFDACECRKPDDKLCLLPSHCHGLFTFSNKIGLKHDMAGVWFACHQSHHQVQRASLRNGPSGHPGWEIWLLHHFDRAALYQRVEQWTIESLKQRQKGARANGFVETRAQSFLPSGLSWFIIMIPYVPYLSATLVCSMFNGYYWVTLCFRDGTSRPECVAYNTNQMVDTQKWPNEWQTVMIIIIVLVISRW